MLLDIDAQQSATVVRLESGLSAVDKSLFPADSSSSPATDSTEYTLVTKITECVVIHTVHVYNYIILYSNNFIIIL
jgi:hypothetical protein